MSVPSSSNIKEPMYNSKDEIKTDTLKTGLKKVKIKEIKQLGLKFHDNLDLVANMVTLPHALLSLEHAKRALVPHEIMAALKSRLEKKDYLQARKEVFESDVLPKMETTLDEAMEGGEKEFSNLLQGNKLQLRNTYEALLYSGTVWMWCGFEVLMKELWELALNIGGSYASKNVIKNLSNLGDPGGIGLPQGRYISLDYLARYGYNISNQLGSALSYKFDFTSVNGIKKAYLRAFPKSIAIRNSLDNKAIIGLEATRNVVVHNAGIVDEEFCKKMNMSKSEIAKRLRLNSRKLSDYGNSTIDVGLHVMTAVSSIVSYARSLRRK